MTSSARLLKAALLSTTIAFALASCGTSGGTDVAALRRVLGTDLIGTKGATNEDQDNINRTVIRAGRASIYTPAEVAAHGRAVQP